MAETITSNYTLLREKLDHFIRKYYLNAMLRGAIYFAGTTLAIYLIISILEYFFYFPTSIRTALLAGFIGFFVLALSYWVIWPLLKYFRLGTLISDHQAAQIIGRHFSAVEDKLLNVLQLQSQASSSEQRTLIEASIAQKTEQLRPVPFSGAINLAYNKRYLKYALIPASVIVLLIIGAPSVLRESTVRLINSNQSFAPPAPFTFHFPPADSLSVVQYEDIAITVHVKGKVRPDEVILHTEDYQYRMQPAGKDTFTYTIRKVKSSLPFYVAANGYQSSTQKITVLPKPMIVNFEVAANYPAYTGRKDATLQNIGDLRIPEGTELTWRFQGKNTTGITVVWPDTTLRAQRQGEDRFMLSRQLFQSLPYTIYTTNAMVDHGDSIRYSIEVIPDQYPEIEVASFADSLQPQFQMLAGTASDDYGLTKVSFRYQHITDKDPASSSEFTTVPVHTNIRSREDQFTFPLNLQEFDLQPGDVFNYYFIVWDNDGVNGAKSARTPMMQYQMPTKEAFREMAREQGQEIQEDLQDILEEANAVQKEIQALRQELLQKSEPTWSDRKQLESLLEKQASLMQQIDKMQQQMDRKLEQQKQYQEEANNTAMEQQEKLQQMMEQAVSKEMKELMKKMQELLQKLDKEELIQSLDKFQMSQEQLAKEMERMKELYKQLEMEARMQDLQSQLEEMAKKQEKLAEETKNQKANETPANETKTSQEKEAAQKKLEQEQQALNEEFEKTKEELEKLESLDKQLGDKMDLSPLEEQQQSTQQQMKQSLQKMQQGENQKASQMQQKAAQQMQEMAQQMSSMMKAGQKKQLEIDIAATRQLLDNLIKLSFDQETLMRDIQAVPVSNPAYRTLIQKQFDIKEDAQMVEDSLLALSKRVVQISSFINKEITEVRYNMEQAISLLADRKKDQGTAKQQYVMTGINNLALMLDEILRQLQQQMSSMMAGQQMCQKPQSGQSMQQLQKMQQQLNQQMSELMKKMNQEGKGQPNKPGQSGKGKRNMSKELAQLAQQQAAIRQAMQKLQQETKNGQQPGNELGDLIQKMEETEEDLVNKRLTEELLQRQKAIEIRMLKAANAEKQQEKSPERQAETAQEISRKPPPALEEYLRKREAEIQLYKTVPPTLNGFYKTIVEDYFRSIDLND